MDILLQVALIAIILIIIFGIILVVHSYISKPAPSKLTSNEALAIVEKDIKLNDPNSTISLLSISKSKITNNSWDMSFRVINRTKSVCPTLEIESYNYPAVSLAPTIISVYSKNCQIFASNTCGDPSSNITLYPIALACAYNSNNYTLNSYITQYGYKNITTVTNFDSNYVIPSKNISYTNVWILNYTSKIANFNLTVISNRDGSIINVYKINK